MDTLSIVESLVGGGLVASLLMGMLKSALDNVSNRWGATISHVLLLFISLAVALIGYYINLVPMNVLIATGAIFSLAMAIYEVLYKGLWQNVVTNKPSV